MVPFSPSKNNTGWHNQDSIQPLTIIGDWSFNNYKISLQTILYNTSSNIALGLYLGGPLSSSGCSSSREQQCVAAYNTNWYNYGYILFIYGNSSWELKSGLNTLSTGNINDFRLNTWFNMTLSNINGNISATLNDDNIVNNIKNTQYSNGWAGVGSSYTRSQFARFFMESME